jgi:hypothetical protein
MKGLLICFLLLALPAWAHDDATLDKVKTGAGGQLRMAGVYHIELVVVRDSPQAKENPLLIYLTDHADKKMPSAGMKVTVTLFGKGVKAAAELKPDGDNRFRGSARYASVRDLKAVVTLTGADGKTVQARFTPMELSPH